MEKLQKLTFSILFFLLFAYANCFKEKLDLNGLPPATQQGKNKLGFLLNGESWTPKGFNGTANLSLYYDQAYQGGVFNLSAYRIISEGVRQRITMFGDSIQKIEKIELPNPKRFGLILSDGISNCDYHYSDSNTVITGGYFELKKLDTINQIFSGQFEIHLKKTSCNDIQITQGRFDMKF